MSIQQQTFSYEYLFRMSPDNQISGCHRRDIEVFINTETSTVVSSRELDPVDISSENLPACFSAINAAAIETLNSQHVLISNLQNEAYAKDQAHQEEIESLTAQLDLANQTIEQMALTIAALQSQESQS